MWLVNFNWGWDTPIWKHGYSLIDIRSPQAVLDYD